MKTAIVTGSGGLVGSQAVDYLCNIGWEVIGVDNNARMQFFGSDGDVTWNINRLSKEHKKYTHYQYDITDDSLYDLFKLSKLKVDLIIHAAAQPSHDWAAKDPKLDFKINAYGTLNMLECYRKLYPDAVFIQLSTNKVYGDNPNRITLYEKSTRYEPIDNVYVKGINEKMSLDQCTHSIFGVSKASGDLMAQEYGKYFNLPIGVFRGGCLTGPMHSGAELHGFLSYLVKCGVTGKEYKIYGYKGKQVRDNIHSLDLMNAFYEFYENPKFGEVYNIGGSTHSNVSVLEAISKVESLTGRPFNYTLKDENRIGDHIWYISDMSKFKEHYPKWNFTYDIDSIINEIYQHVNRVYGNRQVKRATTPKATEIRNRIYNAAKNSPEWMKDKVRSSAIESANIMKNKK